jgi:hypothetical protein
MLISPILSLTIPHQPPTAVVPVTENALARATQLLRRGQNYNEAIRLLREVNAEQKNNALTKAYLACALLGRAASLALAEKQSRFYIEDREKYAEMTNEWEHEKNLPTSAWYKQPTPKAPVLCTWDDGRLYTPTTESQNAINALCAEAYALSKESIIFSKSEKERGEMLHLSSWAQTIYHILNMSISEKIKSDIRKQIISDSHSASILCPENEEIQRNELDIFAILQYYDNTYIHSQQISGVKNFKFMQMTKEEKRKKYEMISQIKRKSINDLYRLYWLSENFLTEFPEESKHFYTETITLLNNICLQNSNRYSSKVLKLNWLINLKYKMRKDLFEPLQKDIIENISQNLRDLNVIKLDYVPLVRRTEMPLIYTKMVPFIQNSIDIFSPNIIPFTEWQFIGTMDAVGSENISIEQKENIALKLLTAYTNTFTLGYSPPSSASIYLVGSSGDNTAFAEKQRAINIAGYKAWKNHYQRTYFTARPW